MATAEFVKTLEKKKEAAALMKSVSNAEAGGGFKLPKIDDGTYVFSITADCGITSKAGVPFVNFKWTIEDEGQFSGKGHKKTYFITTEDREGKEGESDKTAARLGADFKTILDTDELDVNTPSDIAALVDAVNQEKPYVRGALKNWESGDNSGFNVFFNEIVDVDE